MRGAGAISGLSPSRGIEHHLEHVGTGAFRGGRWRRQRRRCRWLSDHAAQRRDQFVIIGVPNPNASLYGRLYARALGTSGRRAPARG